MVEPVGAQFGRDLEPNGLNLEGLAIVGGVLYAGLRAPSLDGYAYIVSTDVEPLFTPDSRGSFRSRSAGMQASVIWRLCLTGGFWCWPARRRTNSTLISPCLCWIPERAASPQGSRMSLVCMIWSM